MAELTQGHVPLDKSSIKKLEQVQKEYILYVYELLAHNKLETAFRLGVSKHTLYRKLESYGVMERYKRTDLKKPLP